MEISDLDATIALGEQQESPRQYHAYFLFLFLLRMYYFLFLSISVFCFCRGLFGNRGRGSVSVSFEADGKYGHQYICQVVFKRLRQRC